MRGWLIGGVTLSLLCGCDQPESNAYSDLIVSGTWVVRVRSDGSGYYTYRGSDEFAKFPRRTFDFDDLLSRLEPTLSDRRDETHRWAVVLMRRSDHVGTARYTSEGDLIESIYLKAYRTYSTDRLRQLWADDPPVDVAAATQISQPG